MDRSIGWFLLAVSLLTCTALASGQHASDEQVLSTVLTWADSLRSFSGAYTVIDHDVKRSVKQETRMVYRMRGGDFYIETLPKHSQQHKELSFARLHGMGAVRQWQHNKPKPFGTANIPDEDFVPNGAFLLPTDWFGTMNRKSLRQQVQQGFWKVRHTDDGYCFLVRPRDGGEGMNLWLDDALHVHRIEYFYWHDYAGPPFHEIEHIDPLDLGYLRGTLELQDVQEINGVRIPTRAVDTFYDFPPDVIKELNKEHMERRITIGEYFRRKVELAAQLRSIHVKTAYIDLQEIEVNPELTDADFVLSFPPSSPVGDLATGRSLDTDPWYVNAYQWGRKQLGW